MEYIIGHATEGDPQQLRLAARNFKQIPNAVPLPLAPVQMRAAIEINLRSVSGLELRSASSGYNCVGMVLGSRRTEIDVAELDWILDADGYRKVALEEVASVTEGDLLVYRNVAGVATHVGLVQRKTPVVETAKWDLKILSQWGVTGEYFHGMDAVNPALGRPSEFRTDRIGL